MSELRNYTDPELLDRAVQRFEAAIAADPTYAAAHAGLCEALVQRYTELETVADVASAERACEQAVRLDRGLPEVHAALGMLYLSDGQHARRRARVPTGDRTRPGQRRRASSGSGGADLTG